jgi:aspartate aminotransferase
MSIPTISGCIGKTSAGGARSPMTRPFATALLEEEGVAVVFGAAFGLSPCFRISYATSDSAARCAVGTNPHSVSKRSICRRE